MAERREILRPTELDMLTVTATAVFEEYPDHGLTWDEICGHELMINFRSAHVYSALRRARGKRHIVSVPIFGTEHARNAALAGNTLHTSTRLNQITPSGMGVFGELVAREFEIAERNAQNATTEPANRTNTGLDLEKYEIVYCGANPSVTILRGGKLVEILNVYDIGVEHPENCPREHSFDPTKQLGCSACAFANGVSPSRGVEQTPAGATIEPRCSLLNR